MAVQLANALYAVWLRISYIVQAALRSVGAAGGGWALLAVLRAIGFGKETKHVKETNPDSDLLVPRHIAVIMDGNRRFGRQKYGDSLSGHRAGGEKLREFILWCSDLNVDFLTVFAFSTENWKRDEKEVKAMMDLFLSEVPRLGEHAMNHNCRVRFLASDVELLPNDVKKAVANLEDLSSSCTGLTLNVCLSYGGRSDVVHACRSIAAKVETGELNPQHINDAMLKTHLLTGDIPDPDVLIRTSGERRLSNFLMFQLAYAELFFLEKHWPEVEREDLLEVVKQFQCRQRRFGK